MTKAKKKSKRNPLERMLWRNEQILWQKASDGTLSDHVAKRFTLAPLSLRSSNAEIWLTLIWVAGGFLLLMFLYTFLIVDYLPLWLQIPLAIIIAIFTVLAMIACLFIPEFISYMRRRFAGDKYSHSLIYAITNHRILLSEKDDSYDILFTELTAIELQDSDEGDMLIWRYNGTGGRHTFMPPFIGLNDFEIQLILNLVEENTPHTFRVVDKRERKLAYDQSEEKIKTRFTGKHPD